MTEDTKPTPRVIRRGDAPASSKAVQALEAESDVFSGTLSNGRTVSFREITAGDLLYLEKTLGNLGEMERSLKLAARVSCGEGRVTFEDLMKLKMKDLKVVTELLTKAGDADEADEDEDLFPNE